MLALELVVLLGTVVLLCGIAAPRLRVAPPVLLLVCGVLLGSVPALGRVHLPPQMMLLVFLPALLWWESLTTSLREIRRNLRGIVLTGSVLVVVTAAAVAALAHALGLAWGPAWVLGAAVAPTDATAVGALARSLPRRGVTNLRAESLINDGTALVVYGLAVGVTVGEQQLSVTHTARLFVVSYVGGILAGAALGWLGALARKHLQDPTLGNVAFLLTPFTAFLVAEEVGASGVLAVVVCGLWMSQAGPRVGRAEMRQQAAGFWTLATFLLNGSLFVLVGLELVSAVRDLNNSALLRGIVAVGAVAVALVVVRYAFLFTTIHIIRAVDRRPQQRLRRVSERSRVLTALAGFRGAVSLAVVLAVPQSVASGAPFPDRDLIVFVTAGVIAVTLVVQAPLLPAVVRWARLPQDTSVAEERQLAETSATHDALSALPQLATDLKVDPTVAEHLQREYAERAKLLEEQIGADENAGDSSSGVTGSQDGTLVTRAQQYTALKSALLVRQRATLLQLRDSGRIDDIVLRPLQSRLDLDEVRLLGRDTAD